MSAATEIQAKYSQLRRRGRNLGSAVGAITYAGSGGYVQIYQRGRIYWHTNTGAHEVHGGILSKYLAEGGPGANPQSGRRHLGFPVSDEERTNDDLYPRSRFEWGEIDYVSGSGGGVTIYGDFYTAWKSQGKEIGKLGHPLTAPIAVAGGEAVYFEGGCLWKGTASKGKVVTCTLDLPQLGRPQLIDPANTQDLRMRRMATWRNIPNDVAESIFFYEPGLFRKLWVDRLVLRSVNKPDTPAEMVVLQAEPMHFGRDTHTGKTIHVTMTIPADGTPPLRDRTLYDVRVKTTNGSTFAIAPHSVYVRSSWEDFGLIHATDIHVSKRLEGFRRRLQRLAVRNPQLASAVTAYNNFNDNFRELIRYANHLHDIGMLDAILATGDLVDYGFEEGERSSFRGGNYAFFEKIIRGQVRSPNGVASEELRVPIYTVLGNHDYRVNPYTLLSTVDVPFADDIAVRHYSNHNLTEAETVALQGGHPKIDPEAAADMIQVDILNQRYEYSYFIRRINALGSYTVNMGDHRVVMIDTGTDAWVPPTTFDWRTQLDFVIANLTGNLSDAAIQAKDGSAPNSKGLSPSDVNRIVGAANDAGDDGLVIVGMHAPPLNLQRAEFPHYFRQTERRRAPRKEMYGYLMRTMSNGELYGLCRGIANYRTVKDIVHGKSRDSLSSSHWSAIFARIDASGKYADWLYHGGDYIKVNGMDSLLDDGIAVESTKTLLEKFAGVGAARPVDLVLSGHHHDRVEYRLWWNNQLNRLQIYTDFYTENPTRYYSSQQVGIKGHVEVTVREGAPLNGRPRLVRDNRHSPPVEYAKLEVPGYALPLNDAYNPRAWWQGHRPLLAATSSLGPIDRNQRSENGRRLEPVFQGFRFISVTNNVISKMRYVTLPELRQNKFRMDWETDALAKSAAPEMEVTAMEMTEQPTPMLTTKPAPVEVA